MAAHTQPKEKWTHNDMNVLLVASFFFLLTSAVKYSKIAAL